jgi:hypothetical protein
MAEVLLMIRDIVERKNALVYAAKCATATLSGGQHFPEFLDCSDPEALLACLLSAIALCEPPAEMAEAA